MSVDEYVRECCGGEDPLLAALYRAANLRLVNGYMSSGHVKGCFLTMLVAMCAARRVVEVGTFAGYSALAMAAALPADGHLLTIDSNDELETFTRAWLARSPQREKVEYVVGDAMTVLPTLSGHFDVAFLDGDKRTYISVYEALLPLLRQGGIIVADDTLWHEHVVDDNYRRDAQTKGIRAFNDFIRDDERVEQVLLPVFNGVTIIRKR